MKIVSVNMNKRFGNPEVRTAVAAWLRELDPDVFLVQEPWKLSAPVELNFEGFRSIDGRDNLHTWAKMGCTIAPLESHIDNLQALRIGHLKLFNVYLSAYSKAERMRSYNLIQQIVLSDLDTPVVLAGDFNTAPNPEDGLFAGRESTWTDNFERAAFSRMLSSLRLVDTTSRSVSGQQDYSIQRIYRGSPLSFRCDLALVSDILEPGLSVRYDHSVREQPRKFTDHSALVIETQVASTQSEHLPFIDEKDMYSPHKTAMSRKGPSTIAKWLMTSGFCGGERINTLLDFGCGRGQDVIYYRQEGLRADGYDPHQPFGWFQEPDKVYDLVAVTFVINVLATPQIRLAALREACKYVKQGGLLLVTARSRKTIQNEASSKSWPAHSDGYWSHEGRGTFQKGIDHKELHALLERIGLRILDSAPELGPDVTCAVGRKV